MPSNTDSQRQRRRDAIFSAVFFSALALMTGAGLLALRRYLPLTGIPGGIALVCGLMDIGAIIPICISLKNRLTEIQGGEEDAAAQY